ncbi:MAG: hypothetical protein RR308_15755, partial [Hafnia sp.]
DVQKTQRLHQAFSRFIGSHLAVAFEQDPEAELRQINGRRTEIEREFNNQDNITQQQRQQLAQAKESVALLHKLTPHIGLLADETLQDRVEEIR